MNASMRPRRLRAGAALLALLLGLLCLAPIAPAAGADEAKPTLEVLEVGWDGNFTAGTWAPIRVKVTGNARDLDALVEVTLENQYQTGPTTSFRYPLGAYAQEISLPANAAKEVTVWVPTGHGLLGTVRLMVGNQEVGKEQIEFRQTKAPFWPLVGVLSNEERLEAWLRRIELPLQGLPQAINVASLQPEALPTQPDRLKALRAIVVQGNAPANLSDGQRKAIADWVAAGGHLLLAGGPDSALTANVLPAGTLPVAFGGTEMSADLGPLMAWGGGTPAQTKGPAVKLQTQSGTVLAGTPALPLAWRMNLGQGTITLLAADPTLEPLASFDGITPLLMQALNPAFHNELQGGEDEKFRMLNMEQDMSYRLRSTIDALPADAYPGWKQVALYLGGFALLAGPAIHLLFWRNQRRGWVWLAVPAASLLVAGAIYGVGVAAAGRDMMGHTISYLQIDPASKTAKQALMVGLYAPMHPELQVKIASDQPVSALGLVENVQFGPWGPQQQAADAKPPFRVVTGRETRMEFNANVWTMRPIALTRTLGPETGKIASHLVVEEGIIKGSVTNETPYHLEDAFVVVGSKIARLGEIKPGQTVDVTLEPGAAADPFRYMPLGYVFFGEKPSAEAQKKMGPVPPGMPEQLTPPRDPEKVRRMRLMESLAYRPKPGPDSVSFPLTFFAFTQDPVGPAVVDLAGHPDHRLSLIEQRLQLDVMDGAAFTLPPTLIPADINMYNMRGMGSGSDGKVSWMEIDYGYVTFTFTPPLPVGAKVTAVEVTTRTMGAVTPSAGDGRRGPAPPNMVQQAVEQAGIFQIFNYASGNWQDLPAGQESVRITDVAPFLGPDLQVQVRVNTGNDKLVRFIVPQLTMEGRGPQ